MPGSGKTWFARWLGHHGWRVVEHDQPETDQHGNELEVAWRAFRTGGNHELLRVQLATPTPLVVEWGFTVNLLFQVIHLIQLGMEAWWFDGDLDASFDAWKQANPDLDDELWGIQVAGIQATWPAIAGVFGPRILRVDGPRSWRLDHQQVATLMGLNVAHESTT
jgi:hypothetical protein